MSVPLGEGSAVIFDIDGTLTPINSWTAFTRDLGASVDDHMRTYLAHSQGQIGLDESKGILLKLWQETGRAKRDVIQSMFESWPIRPDAIELVHWLQQEGYEICLITGSVGMYAECIAQQLGISHWYANAELYFDWQEHLVAFHYTANQSDVKVGQFLDYCRKQGVRPENCTTVGDGDNDIGLFELTQRGILVTEGKHDDGYHGRISPELRKSAWREVTCLADVPALLTAQ